MQNMLLANQKGKYKTPCKHVDRSVGAARCILQFDKKLHFEYITKNSKKKRKFGQKITDKRFHLNMKCKMFCFYDKLEM